jgi:wobble nucleotide-excising tRNase
MIDSITISNIATYDGVGVRIDNLKRANFIYGANGTGKTTITKLLNEEALPEFSQCSVAWRGGLQLETLIYNKDIRDRNFGKGEIDGVFTLGEATKEEKEAIEKMVTELQEIKAEGIQKKEALEKLNEQKTEAEDSFRDAAWVDVYKKHEVVFKDAFVGVMRKEAFRDKLVTQASTNKAGLKPFDELKTLASTIFGKAPEELSLVNNLDYARLLEIEADVIWEKKIIGKADIEIAKLIQHLNMNDWVNEGRSYLQESDVCPFCQEETITGSFRKQLDEYFDQAFKEDTQRVKSLSSEYSIAAQNLLNLLGGLESKEKENSNSKLNLESLAAYIKTVSAQLRTNEEFTKSKGKEPSRSFTLTPLKEPLDSIAELIGLANKEVTAHNKVVDNYAKEKANLVEAVWKYLAEEYSASIAGYTSTISGRQKGIDALEKKKKDLLIKYKELDQKIKDANKNVTSVQPSVDEINNTLKAYGFLNFEIVPSSSDKNQYQIHREDGSIAESTLSEGEITFITFLYFLQRAKGGLTEDAVSNERVLVVDDPISSLDSNVLFVVSSLIKEILNEVRADRGVIKQVILLTHNVYFHKEVSYINGKAEENRNTYFWILRKKNKISTIEPYLMSNPIHNSYELLWRELKKDGENDCITIQNTMRRIIENYFKILGKYHYDDLIKSFPNIEEQEICRSMVCWINDGSHTIPDDLFIQSHDDSKDKYFAVFEQIFINTNHHEHFKMMMGIRDEAQDAEGGEAPEELEVSSA